MVTSLVATLMFSDSLFVLCRKEPRRLNFVDIC
jgi:hypothetical protein